jgi:hypothetical protein
MKKVGILTFFRPINNGAVLQACAMAKIILPKLGYTAELIDYRFERIEIDRSIFGIKRILREPGKVKKARRVIADIVRFPINYRQKKIFDVFIHKNLPVSRNVYYSEEDLEKRCQGYDAYVVGSDLVWSPTMAGGVNPIYFLGFVNNNKLKVAYAPSVGTMDLSNKDIKDFKLLLSNFDAISVREESTAAQLRELTGYDVKSVLDPTLLTDSKDWNGFYSSKMIFNDEYILAFALETSQVLIDTVNRLAKETGAIVVAYGRKNKLYKARRVVFLDGKCGPAEFLNYVNNAFKVVTNSFHGCAFSIVFHKDFYCIPHTTRGIRMIDLLASLNLDKRIITNATDLPKEHIDYDSVEQKRKEMKEKSMVFLKNSLDSIKYVDN